MSINNSSIDVGATFAPTGGVATTFKTKLSGNPHRVFLDDGSTLDQQTTADFGYKEPKVSTGAPNGYTQARNTLFIRVPKVLGNGNLTYNTIKIEISCDVETTVAEKASLRELGIHGLNDSDYTEFWDDQSAA